MSEHEQPQQEFLQAAKASLGLTWDELAEQAGIAPRALKNYRMPDDSQNHRSMHINVPPTHWPTENETVSVECPWCGASMETFIASAREWGLEGRLDDCRTCCRPFIVEAHPNGIEVSKGVPVQDEPFWVES